MTHPYVIHLYLSNLVKFLCHREVVFSVNIEASTHWERMYKYKEWYVTPIKSYYIYDHREQGMYVAASSFAKWQILKKPFWKGTG